MKKPRAAETIEEVRYEAMGCILGIIDTARRLAPPPSMTGRQALLSFAAIAETSVREAFGEELYDHFKATVRAAAGEN